MKIKLIIVLLMTILYQADAQQTTSDEININAFKKLVNDGDPKIEVRLKEWYPRP